MSSILTNNGAMVALQTLRTTNANLTETQAQISTGKKIGSAKDNAAIWSVAKTMETDVSSYKVINDSLGSAEANVSTAMAGSNRVSDLLSQMKDLAAGAITGGTDLDTFKEQLKTKVTEISSVIKGTQLNGVNLLKDTADGGTASFDALASLDRSTGSATTVANKISVTNLGLNTATGVADDGVSGTLFDAVDAMSAAAGDEATLTAALTAIETSLDNVITKTASLGSVAENISSQREFVGALTDSLKAGMGSLVDANMEEASARLQALQTQQQLGVQSLSIANQAPQSILSLFR